MSVLRKHSCGEPEVCTLPSPPLHHIIDDNQVKCEPPPPNVCGAPVVQFANYSQENAFFNICFSVEGTSEIVVHSKAPVRQQMWITVLTNSDGLIKPC